MPETAAATVHARAPRRWLVPGAIIGAVLLLLALGLRFALQPARVTRLVLERTGAALGLEITASGVGEYRLRGTPTLVVRNVVARQPGATTPLLRADRIFLSLPWSTIRARGSDLTVTRIELDAPVLDLPALQHWLASRPPSETRIPTLSDGLQVTNGRVTNGAWQVDGIDLQLPSLSPTQPVNARIRGRYLDAPTKLTFDLAVAMTRPRGDAGVGVAGPLTLDRGNWQLPAHARFSGRLRAGGLRLAPARLAMSGRYRSGDTTLPFALGLSGALQAEGTTVTFAPVAVALRGKDLVPTLDARGALALGKRLVVQLDGDIAAWPQAWPALPPPVGESNSPLPFGLRYLGAPDLSGIASLRLQRDTTRFDGRFRLADLSAWIGRSGRGSPLPPLDGRVTTPRMDIAGAQLEGVDATFDDPDIPDIDGNP